MKSMNPLSRALLVVQSLVNYYLDRIDKHKDLNVYIEVFGEEALLRAKNIDEKFLLEPQEDLQEWLSQ